MKINPDIKFEITINDVAVSLILRALRFFILAANNEPDIKKQDTVGARALMNTLESSRMNAHKHYKKKEPENIDDMIVVQGPRNCPQCDD